MNLFYKITLEPRLPLDGIMTLLAGVIAFIAVLLQIRSSREAVERQLREERVARVQEEERQRQAVAKALLFEIANFYGYYRVRVRPSLDRKDPETCLLPPLSAPGSGFFAVYQGNSGRLGAFEHVLVEKVVKFYGVAELLLTSIREYTWSLARELERQGSVPAGSAPRILLKQIQDVMYTADSAGMEAMQKLCGVVGTTVESLKLPS
jgi:hypothetical protein